MRWDTGAEIAPENYARLRADPRYPEAVRSFASNMLAAGDADRLLDGILKDAGRNVAALCAIHVHLSGGLTRPRLKTLCASFGLVSPGRARALLLYLRYLGYVEPSAGDRRGAPAVYVPTARFHQTWRNHLLAVLASVRVLEPAVDLLLERFDAPGVFETFAKMLCEVFLGGSLAGDVDTPYYRVFMHRNAGIQIVHALLSANPEDVFPPVRPIAISLSATARRFKVSRIHVRRLLDAAQREGLLRLGGDGTVAFEPAGRQAVDYVFSAQIICFLIAAGRDGASFLRAHRHAARHRRPARLGRRP